MKILKFKFVFYNKEVKESIISSPYSIEQLLETSLEEIQEKSCNCNCQPIGETNVVECNCSEYYDKFELIGKLQYTNSDCDNGNEIYDGDYVYGTYIEGYGPEQIRMASEALVSWDEFNGKWIVLCDSDYFDLYDFGESGYIGNNIYNKSEFCEIVLKNIEETKLF